ncbi:P4 family phage/plasmid primase-like protein [Halarchaeum solikamskense]|uniref:phage/plasmid primase, P4 family n=1 Tax=Halarchaeum nitratireducens TaxID=489913 RepID=UPI001B3AC8ED|nr:phage/plasmid primase, P4 family [Halarchaeum solikamskense]MBP2251273.1 P4 family phage/plasmid primase-like protein [Halarchaeum solikamskense]
MCSDRSIPREVIAARFDDAGLSTDRYVSVVDGEKKCLDHDTRYNSPPGGNYGVYCDADDRLVVLDVDDYDGDGINPGLAAVEALPETLADHSPHGGTHYYYRVEMSEGRMPAAVLEDEFGVKNPTASWGEIQVANKYVLAAGNELESCHKDWHDCSEDGEGQYEIAEGAELAVIDAETLVEVLAADPDIERETEDDHEVDTGREDGSATEDWVDQRLEKAREHDETLDALMDGDYSEFRDRNGVDRSKAEASLASRLAFWLEGDTHAVRDVIEYDARTKKWDERGESYRESVMEAAEQVTTYYDPETDISVDHEADAHEVYTLSHEERWELAETDIQRIVKHYEGGEDVEVEISERRLRERVARVLKYYWTWLYPSGGEEPIMGWADEVLYWRNPETGRYEMNGASKVEGMVEDLLGAHSTDATIREVTNKVARKSYTGREEIKAREPPESHLMVGNGVVNLETGELVEEPDPETLYRHRVPVDYQPGAECEYIDARFREWVDEDYVTTLYRIAAHTIYPGYPTKRVALLPGEGDNGKGMYIDVLNALVGAQNVTHRGLGDLSDYRFAKNDLEGKLANLEGDLSPEEIEDTGPLKKLTGGDPVTADVKQEASIKFRNKATLVAAVNTVPELPEDNHAIWRRWLYIPFSNKFTGDEKIPEHKLRSNLTREDQLKGLLARAIDELCEWWQNDDREFYPNAGEPEEVREQMMNAANPVRDFATTVFREVESPGEPDEDWDGKKAAFGKVLKENVVDAYEQYAEEENVPRMNSQKLKGEIQQLAAYDIEGKQTKALSDDSSVEQCFAGVEWTARGAQLAGIDHPDADDAQDALDDTQVEQLAEGVTVADVREYVENHPETDVYEVMREFRLGGDAFDVVERLVAGTLDDDSEDDDDDPDAGAGVTDDGDDPDADVATNDADESNTSDDGDDTDASSPDRRYTAEQKEEAVEAMAEDTNESAEEIAETLLIRSEDEDEVSEIVAEVRGDGNDAEEPAPPAPPEPDTPPVTDVPTQGEDEDGIEYDTEEIGDPGDVVAAHGEVDAGVEDVDVIVIPRDEFGIAVEAAYGRGVEFRTPEGDVLGGSE